MFVALYKLQNIRDVMSNIADKQAFASRADEDEIDLSAILNHLLENRWMILIVTLCALAIGVFYASRQIPQYESDVLLQIESGQSSLGQTAAMSQQFMFRGAGSDPTSTQIALIKSRYILEPVIQSLGLDISVRAKQNRAWAWMPSLKNKNMQIKSFNIPRNQVNQPFTVSVDQPAHIKMYNSTGQLLLQGPVGLSLTSADKRIQLIIEAIQAPVGTQFSLVKHSDASMVKSLAKRLKITEANGSSRLSTGIMELSLAGPNPTALIQTLNAIAKTTQAKDAQKKAQEAAQTLDFLYHQLPLTKGLLEKAETALNQYRSKSGKLDIKQQIQFFLNRLSDLDKQLSVLSVNRIDMLQRYTTKHPLLIALDTQISALEAQRNKLEKELKTLPASDQIAVNLMRDVGVKKTLYLLLLRKIQELEVVKAGTVSSVHILSYAKMPDSALPGKRELIYLASIIVGVLLSFVLIAGRKLLSPRVTDPHWGEKHFNIANLAIIPYCKEQTENTLQFKEKAVRQLPLLANSNPRNLAIESLRSLRTSLQVTLTCAHNNIISILGVSPGVGKSFVSANLAYLLAAGGKRVLLIDGDLRRGTLHKYINVPPMPGLTEVLKNTATVESAITATLHENLDFIPRGVYPADPSELLMSHQFKELMHTFAHQYDVVLIDTAPVLLVTDAVIIGAIAATNYLIMGAGAHQPGDIEMVIKRLSGSNVKVQGTIFNFYKNESITRSYGQYGKYGKYGYYNKYYYDESLKT